MNNYHGDTSVKTIDAKEPRLEGAAGRKKERDIRRDTSRIEIDREGRKRNVSSPAVARQIEPKGGSQREREIERERQRNIEQRKRKRERETTTDTETQAPPSTRQNGIAARHR